MRKFTFIAALALALSANATVAHRNTTAVGHFAPANTPTPIPYGVVIKDGVIVSWPAELIPEDGIIVLDENIKGIGAKAFSETPLKSIILPKSLKTIEANAFAYCNLLQGIVIPEGVEKLGESAFYQCHGMQTVSIPSTIKTMEPNAFAMCDRIQKLLIAEGCTVIGESAFYECRDLAEVKLPISLTTIGDNAFAKCGMLREIAIPGGVRTILATTFADCSSLEKVQFTEGLESIGRYAFKNCTSLKTVSLPENLTTLGDLAFQGCAALENIAMPKTLSEIGSSLFQDCIALKSVVIPEGVKTIHVSAFRGCKALEAIKLPEGVKEIKHSAFLNCVSLQTIELPSTLEQIALNAFTGCGAIEKVSCKSVVPPATHNSSFNKTPGTKTLSVPAAAIEDYKEAWKEHNFAVVEAIKEETPENPGTEKPNEGNVAVYDFDANPWKLETSSVGDDPEVGHILDGEVLEVNGVELTFKKISNKYWNRIMDGTLKAYKQNTMTFTAPAKMVITKIEFANKPYQCDLKEVSQTGGTYGCANEEADKPYVWTGRASVVTFGAEMTSTIYKITVTVENEVANAIQTIRQKRAENGKVYNLQGVAVGTESTVSSLPSGIYILNGKKFVK